MTPSESCQGLQVCGEDERLSKGRNFVISGCAEEQHTNQKPVSDVQAFHCLCIYDCNISSFVRYNFSALVFAGRVSIAVS